MKKYENLSNKWHTFLPHHAQAGPRSVCARGGPYEKSKFAYICCYVIASCGYLNAPLGNSDEREIRCGHPCKSGCAVGLG